MKNGKLRCVSGLYSKLFCHCSYLGQISVAGQQDADDARPRSEAAFGVGIAPGLHCMAFEAVICCISTVLDVCLSCAGASLTDTSTSYTPVQRFVEVAYSEELASSMERLIQATPEPDQQPPEEASAGEAAGEAGASISHTNHKCGACRAARCIPVQGSGRLPRTCTRFGGWHARLASGLVCPLSRNHLGTAAQVGGLAGGSMRAGGYVFRSAAWASALVSGGPMGPHSPAGACGFFQHACSFSALFLGASSSVISKFS